MLIKCDVVFGDCTKLGLIDRDASVAKCPPQSTMASPKTFRKQWDKLVMDCLDQAEVDKKSFLEESPIMGYSKKLTSFKNARDRMVPSRSVYTKDVKIAIIALRRVMDKVDFMAYRLLCIVKDGHYLYAVPSARRDTHYAGCIIFHLGRYQQAFGLLRLYRDVSAFEDRKASVGPKGDPENAALMPRVWIEALKEADCCPC